MNKRIICLALLAVVGTAQAEAPALKNTGPIIYLADNLDKKDKLGYCIDTQDRGQTERIQAHSCKPNTTKSQDRDVLFSYDDVSGKIEHAEFAGFCLTINAVGSTTALGLYECEDEKPAQQFTHNQESGSLTPRADESFCLSVADASRNAGPFMSRALELQPCASTSQELRTWVVLGG